VEHPHRCVYCNADWFCFDDCPLAGPAVCDRCREKVRGSPDMPIRVVPLHDRAVMDHLARHEGERLREALWRRRPPRS
jgi:hypothetical protein